MEFLLYGTDFNHKVGEFSNRKKSPSWFISQFLTDFVYEKNGKLLKGNAGDYLIIRKGEEIYHGPTDELTCGFVNDWVFLDGDDFTWLITEYRLPIGVAFSVKGNNSFKNVINKIHKELSFCSVGYKQKCNNVITDFVIDLYRDYISNGKTADDRLEYARGEIISNYAKNWTLSEMAKLSGYSVSRFSALYKEKFKTSPVNDLIYERIEKAKKLLLYGNLSVSECSDMVGFSTIYYFSKFFKQKEGVSPSEYLKINKNNF